VAGRAAHCFNAAGHARGDRNPSLKLFPESGRYKCYSCGIGGDAIDLVRQVRGVSFVDAVAWLGQLAGGGQLPRAGGFANPLQRGHEPSDAAREIYHQVYSWSYRLRQSADEAWYLMRRGIDLDVADKAGAGIIVPRELWPELTDKYALSDLRDAGLVSGQDGFLFARHTLLFSYMADGKVQYLQARDVTGNANVKELSLAGYRSPVPFNGDVLREPQDRVFICEGCLDTISALQLGYPAIGIPGVQGFREEWFALFGNVGSVLIAFDNDQAGQRVAVKLRSEFRLRRIRADVVLPSQGKDINDQLTFRMEKQRGKSSVR